MRASLGFVGLLLVGMVAGAAARADASGQDGEALAQRVSRALADLDELADLEVIAEDRVVTLKGRAPSVWVKERAIDRARRAGPLEAVVSELTIPRAESDEAIGVEALERINRYEFYTMFDSIDVRVDQGVVTLTGAVADGFRSREIRDRVARIPGVQEVRNEIDQLPAGGGPLRASLARRIYRHPVFQKYAQWRVPPIHILVDNGNVTLAGAVGSTLERQLAEHIALSTFGVLGVTNSLEIE